MIQEEEKRREAKGRGKKGITEGKKEKNRR